MKCEIFHEKAVRIAASFHRAESELIDVLQQINDGKVFLHLPI
jgi:hypothetical protein